MERKDEEEAAEERRRNEERNKLEREKEGKMRWQEGRRKERQKVAQEDLGGVPTAENTATELCLPQRHSLVFLECHQEVWLPQPCHG
jgi:hypothetical protein